MTTLLAVIYTIKVMSPYITKMCRLKSTWKLLIKYILRPYISQEESCSDFLLVYDHCWRSSTILCFDRQGLQMPKIWHNGCSPCECKSWNTMFLWEQCHHFQYLIDTNTILNFFLNTLISKHVVNSHFWCQLLLSVLLVTTIENVDFPTEESEMNNIECRLYESMNIWVWVVYVI